MTIFTPSAFLVQASTPDTVAMVVAPNLLSTIEAISTIVLGVAVLGVLVALLVILIQLRKLARVLGSVAKRMEKDASPVMERARSVAANVDFITMAVRTDVQKLTASVSGLNERLREASVSMEERIQDFSALVEVLQNEAEDLALDTAAAVRGMRAGTRSLAGADGEEETGSPGSKVFPSSSETGEAEE